LLFNTLDFAVFLAVVLGLYAVLPHRAQNLMLLAASYFFYGVWDWRFAGLLLFTTTVDHWIARALDGTTEARARKRLLLASIFLNLGILGVFKYFDFFAANAERLLRGLGLEVPALTLGVILPVGVSFYTFQELSYVVDVYRGDLKAARRFTDFALFVAFFPQLVAGPIERATRLLPQIQERRRVTWSGIQSGTWLILLGIFKKVFVADNLAHLVDAVYDPSARPTGLEQWLGVYAFAFQIYCDFAGYSDVARGSARLMGFELMKNFDLPYSATSLRELWRRWHISLTTWLRDYLYIPLGGNRVGKVRHYFNMLTTMILCGFWHGAAWVFVLWGVLHAVALALQHALAPALARLPARGPAAWAWKALGWLLTFHLWCLFFVPFRSADLAQTWAVFVNLFGDWNVGMAGRWLPSALFFVVPLVLVELHELVSKRDEALLDTPLLVRAPVYAVLFAALVVFAEDHARPFIYFQF
jgi:D-alanyl-lipoteichoic acid acyltransferase DltB (MBOAT superfamily)